MDADGSNLTWIGGMLQVPEVDIWSPDGSKVAFVVCPERPILPAELYVVNADGTGLTNVSNHPAHDVVKCQTDAPFGGFDWSPDGTRLVFHSSRDPRGLYVVNADGSGLAFLVDGVLPSWSPTGEMIAFIGQTDEANWEMDLEVIRPDGSGRILLARIPCFLSFLGAACQPTPVRWSPDGTLLVFAANPTPPPAGPQLPESINSVYTLGAAGSGLTRVTDSPGEDFAPIWVDCSRPTAGCEAKVTNVASEGLNVRQEPNKDASRVGKLGDGELVCFIGPSRFIDGFRWWPVRSEAGIEGWSAAFDPDEPNVPWLTATGRTCQGPILFDQPKIVFVRSEGNEGPQSVGELWISNIDGSHEQQLTPGGVDAIYIGLVADPESMTHVLYYTANAISREDRDQVRDQVSLELYNKKYDELPAKDVRRNRVDAEVDRRGGNTDTLWRLDFGTGERSSIASFEANLKGTTGAVSPDGGLAAIGHAEGIDLIDLTTGHQRRLPTDERANASVRSWSPDGRLLLVGKGFIEGGTLVVVDPLKGEAQDLVEGQGPSGGAWSPASDSICSYGQYGGPQGPYLSQAPNWQDTRDALAGNDQFDSSTAYVDDCVWLDGERIAFTSQATFGGASGVFSYDLTTDEVVQVYSIGGECHDIVAVPGTPSVVYQPCFNPDVRPQMVNLEDGTRTPVLQAGDWVAAVVEP